MKKYFIYFCVSMVQFSSCTTKEGKNQKSETIPKEEVGSKPTWTYKDVFDKSMDTYLYFARLEASQKIQIKGDKTIEITPVLSIQDLGGYDRVLFGTGIEDGSVKFALSLEKQETETIKITFDEKEVIVATYNNNGNEDNAFIEEKFAKPIIEKLKIAKKISVEVPIQGNSRKIIYFDVQGLVWDKSKHNKMDTYNKNGKKLGTKDKPKPQPEFGGVILDKSQFGEKWPLAVDWGEVTCENMGIFFYANGNKYAVNGTSKSSVGKKFIGVKIIKEIDEIWLSNPEMQGTKISIGPIISTGLELCGK